MHPAPISRPFRAVLSVSTSVGCAVVSTLAGGGAGTAAAFANPYGVAVDASGNVLVGDRFNNRIRRVTPSGGTQHADGNNGEMFFVFGFCCFVLFVFIRSGISR